MKKVMNHLSFLLEMRHILAKNITLLSDAQLPPALRTVAGSLTLSHKVHGHEGGLVVAFSVSFHGGHAKKPVYSILDWEEQGVKQPCLVQHTEMPINGLYKMHILKVLCKYS